MPHGLWSAGWSLRGDSGLQLSRKKKKKIFSSDVSKGAGGKLWKLTLNKETEFDYKSSIKCTLFLSSEMFLQVKNLSFPGTKKNSLLRLTTALFYLREFVRAVVNPSAREFPQPIDHVITRLERKHHHTGDIFFYNFNNLFTSIMNTDNPNVPNICSAASFEFTDPGSAPVQLQLKTPY